MFKQGLESLKSSTFEEIPSEKVAEVLNGNTFGYSKINFISKDNDGNLRPIDNNPSLLNGSVFSYNEVHKHLKQFKQYLTHKRNPKLYFIKVDVKCCFDTIDQHKLMEIIRANVLTKTQYVYADELAKKYKNAIFVENVKETYKELEDVLELLEEHIRKNIIKADDKYYTQKIGILQGSILSSLLCSIYYGVMEHSELQFVKDDNGILLHLLDDFLYISTKKENAIKFVTVMHQGHPEYQCIINKKKTIVNFNIKISGEDIKVCNQEDIADTLTIKTRNPGKSLKQKMIQFMITKCHWILYDTSLNDRTTVLLNIYHNFLITAMKFHNYIKGMPKRNEGFETGVVHDFIISIYHTLCRTKNQSNCTFKILKEEVIWLGIYGFLQILNKKKQHHKGLLSYLKKIFKDFRLRDSKLLNTVVNWKHSLTFKNMKF
ncbi:telomerase reverse transcriptase [Rhizophagus clarus]|uniref:Telomerase reverse transcriptase n=1 Tax=Rhizophagus clarus TaxID=94130 RepID=A0A8H3LB45_9GLOM|nr:telomerase reverse transcriptase [Rhizophagus clarus]